MADVRGSTPLGSTVKYTSDLRKRGSEVFCSRQAVRSGPAARGPRRTETFLTVVTLAPCPTPPASAG